MVGLSIAHLGCSETNKPLEASHPVDDSKRCPSEDTTEVDEIFDDSSPTSTGLPGDLSILTPIPHQKLIVEEEGGTFPIRWSKVPYATEYLVRIVADGGSMLHYSHVPSTVNELSLTVKTFKNGKTRATLSPDGPTFVSDRLHLDQPGAASLAQLTVQATFEGGGGVRSISVPFVMVTAGKKLSEPVPLGVFRQDPRTGEVKSESTIFIELDSEGPLPDELTAYVYDLKEGWLSPEIDEKNIHFFTLGTQQFGEIETPGFLYGTRLTTVGVRMSGTDRWNRTTDLLK